MMNTIQLHTDMPRHITMIPNAFLDHYMAGANGEFLKIYLFSFKSITGFNVHFIASL